MALESDLRMNASKFAPSSVDNTTKGFNEYLQQICERTPKWWEVGAEKYRQMRANGETAFPKFTVVESGKDGSIPSREAGRHLATRIFEPEGRPSKGIYLHIHGGGFVLQRHNTQDILLKSISDASDLTVISVDYRLGPENKFPAGPEDCYDAGEWLVDNAKKVYGQELLFIGGESAGAHLSAATLLYLMKTRPQFQFKGVALMYGIYDLSAGNPQRYNWHKNLILSRQGMDEFMQAVIPGKSIEETRHPSISPVFTNLPKLMAKASHQKLPPAFFACGTEDPLLDDTLLMGMKWMMTGSEAIVKIYPGAPHGFSLFPPQGSPACKEYREHLQTFLLSKISDP